MLQRISYLTLILALFHITACESYDFTVNDKKVYTAKPLFSDFQVSDKALYDCLKQTIVDLKITGAGQLKSLNCAHAGIGDIEGLAAFSALSRLKLSSNAIRNLSEISLMTSLQELYLDNNVIIDPVPLYQLPALQILDLSGNKKLQCPSAQAFAQLDSVELPGHCH